MGLDVTWDGVTLATGAQGREQDGGWFVELEQPMPVGTTLVLAGDVNATVRVVRVSEGAGGGVVVARADRRTPAADRQPASAPAVEAKAEPVEAKAEPVEAKVDAVEAKATDEADEAPEKNGGGGGGKKERKRKKSKTVIGH